jgi:effector-binding domain-containing protein
MAYEIEVKDLADRYVATIRLTTTPDKLGDAFRDLLPEVDAEILEAGSRPAGPPFALYHAYHDDSVDLEAGFPLEQPVATSGRVIGRELQATFAAVAWHHGSYDGIGAAHRAVESWMQAEGKEASGPPWEVYWTGPRDDPEPANWVTEVGYPFRGDP